MPQKIPHQIAQLFLSINLMLTHITAALVLPLRVLLVLIKRHSSVSKDII